MARKNFLEGLADLDTTQDQPSPAYPMRGASKTMIRSLDEIARQADKFLEGEAIVELETEKVDGSFISDRLGDDEADFAALVEAIRTRGQDTPILVRPHADHDGRYQVVFGHRRLKAAKELGRKVRAIVKSLDDRTHVIAQGQENSARANLSFIERALFAKRLDERGFDREVMLTALATNAASLSKMMSVVERIPAELIDQIGHAPSVGRERWIELSLLVGKQANARKIRDAVEAPEFSGLPSDQRFAVLLTALNKSMRPVKKTDLATSNTRWQPADEAVLAEIRNTGKSFSLSMKAGNAGRFGHYISSRLDALYAQFLHDQEQNGD